MTSRIRRLRSSATKPLVSHAAWSLSNLQVQAAAYLLVESADFVLVSLGILVGTQAGQLARSAALEAGLSDGAVGSAHIKLALLLGGTVSIALGGVVILILDRGLAELVGLAVAALLAMFYDTSRNTALLTKRYELTVRSDLTWLIVSALLLLLVAVRLIPATPLSLLAAWAIGAASGAAYLVGSGVLKSQHQLPLNANASISFGWDYVSVAGAAQAFILLATVTSGVGPISTLRLGQLILAPVNFVVTGVRSVLFQTVDVDGRSQGRIRQISGIVIFASVAAAVVSFRVNDLVAVLLLLGVQRLAVMAGLLASVVLRKTQRLSFLNAGRTLGAATIVLGWYLTRGAEAASLSGVLLVSAIVFLLIALVPARSTQVEFS